VNPLSLAPVAARPTINNDEQIRNPMSEVRKKTKIRQSCEELHHGRRADFQFAVSPIFNRQPVRRSSPQGSRYMALVFRVFRVFRGSSLSSSLASLPSVEIRTVQDSGAIFALFLRHFAPFSQGGFCCTVAAQQLTKKIAPPTLTLITALQNHHPNYDYHHNKPHHRNHQSTARNPAFAYP